MIYSPLCSRPTCPFFPFPHQVYILERRWKKFGTAAFIEILLYHFFFQKQIMFVEKRGEAALVVNRIVHQGNLEQQQQLVAKMQLATL